MTQPSNFKELAEFITTRLLMRYGDINKTIDDYNQREPHKPESLDALYRFFVSLGLEISREDPQFEHEMAKALVERWPDILRSHAD